VILSRDKLKEQEKSMDLTDRQYRHAAKSVFMGVPAASSKPPEDPLQGAKRSAEETATAPKSAALVVLCQPRLLAETMKVFLPSLGCERRPKEMKRSTSGC